MCAGQISQGGANGKDWVDVPNREKMHSVLLLPTYPLPISITIAGSHYVFQASQLSLNPHLEVVVFL